MVELRADCSRCVGLCCVAPAFARSTDFAIDKPAGTPCTHLQADFRCGIHADLRERGFAGCTVFDCLGAGQRVTAAFAGRDWRVPDVAGPMFAAFAVARQVHELLWYLDEARVRAPDPTLDEEWARLAGPDLAGPAIAGPAIAGPAIAGPAIAGPAIAGLDVTGRGVAGFDVDEARERVGELLRQASERLRTPAVSPPPTHGESSSSTRRVRQIDTASPDFRRTEARIPARRARDGRPGRPQPPGGRGDDRPRDHSRADLVGVQWHRADLRRASLRGALLLGADLRDADLRLADLLGADLRGADLRGADLSTSLFFTPMQAAAARGDAATRLPPRIAHPAHWSGTP